MPKSNKSINKDLYDLLMSRNYDVEMMSSDGKEAPVPEDADVFMFHFKSGDQNTATVTISIDSDSNFVVYYNPDEDYAHSEEWSAFVKQLRRFCLRNRLRFKLQNQDRLQKDMKLRTNRNKIDEGYYGNKHTSYSDSGPSTVKMIIKHNKTLGENDARFRFVERIFLENEIGERVLAPTAKPAVGRVFARHLAEGGQYRDERWQHIAEMADDVNRLGAFGRATKTKKLNESAKLVVAEAVQHYQRLRESLRRMQGARGYNSYFENYQPALMEDGDNDTSTLLELFKNDATDPRIENALPVLKRLNVTVMETADVSQFESWADGIVAEMLRPAHAGQQDDLIGLLGPESEFMPLGPDASSAIGELDGILEDKELFARLKQAAKRDPNRDARAIITAWMSEQRGDDYDEILDKIEPKSDVDGVKDEPEEVEGGEEPAPEADAEEPADDSEGLPDPNTLGEGDRSNLPKPRNFVAKNAVNTGAGKHRDAKSDYKRKEKHQDKNYGKQMDVAESSVSADDVAGTLNSYGYYTKNAQDYVHDKTGDRFQRAGSQWKHQSGTKGRGPEELDSFLSSKQGVAESALDRIKRLSGL